MPRLKTGNHIAMGGTLTQATVIAQPGNTFNLPGCNVGLGTNASTQELNFDGPNRLLGLTTAGVVTIDASESRATN
ncbi:hypothetical protein [Hymenobacter guriensis]|uniref:Uncharacterized protein n=1 Tax=Hymenobacter guriensis TaxID=2793065 RepID=A0ABS0L4B2_9BACT|nr:hypothetical protein [Hymenobacter guriensis]MBG8554975.1 hypothetical protein [Hymenobacter guriensis]